MHMLYPFGCSCCRLLVAIAGASSPATRVHGQLHTHNRATLLVNTRAHDACIRHGRLLQGPP